VTTTAGNRQGRNQIGNGKNAAAAASESHHTAAASSSSSSGSGASGSVSSVLAAALEAGPPFDLALLRLVQADGAAQVTCVCGWSVCALWVWVVSEWVGGWVEQSSMMIGRGRGRITAVNHSSAPPLTFGRFFLRKIVNTEFLNTDHNVSPTCFFCHLTFIVLTPPQCACVHIPERARLDRVIAAAQAWVDKVTPMLTPPPLTPAGSATTPNSSSSSSSSSSSTSSSSSVNDSSSSSSPSLLSPSACSALLVEAARAFPNVHTPVHAVLRDALAFSRELTDVGAFWRTRPIKCNFLHQKIFVFVFLKHLFCCSISNCLFLF
jgi:hypothetical protein